MRYFIHANNNLVETTDEAYSSWHSIFAKELLFDDRVIPVGNIVHSIETMFQGCIDKGEALLPFVLIHFTDKLEINPDGIKQEYEKEDIDYFETHAEFKKAYDALVAELEAQSLAAKL